MSLEKGFLPHWIISFRQKDKVRQKLDQVNSANLLFEFWSLRRPNHPDDHLQVTNT